MAVANHNIQSSSVIDPSTITTVVPVFVAIMVWVIRILIIGTLSLAMDRLLHPGVEQHTPLERAMSSTTKAVRANTQTQVHATQPMSIPASLNSSAIPARPNTPRAAAPNTRYSRSMVDDQDHNISEPSMRSRPEPTYHSLSMSSRPSVNQAVNENTGANRTRQ